MNFLSFANVLKLTPLFRLFRQRVETNEIPLEESVKTLAYASDLIVLKLRWLLPNARIVEEQVEEGEEILPSQDIPDMEIEPAMERWEVDAATRSLFERMAGTARTFSRGHTPAFEGGRQLLVANVDPEAVRDSLVTAQRRTGGRERILVVPRLSFVTHLRDFWKEVRRLTARGAVLRFSRFLGKTKQEAILNFLAFLELIKRRRLHARQEELFGEIEFSTTHEAKQEPADREGVSWP